MTLPMDAKQIPGWPEYYATPSGEIWSTQIRGRHCGGGPHRLSSSVRGKGYLGLRLTRGGEPFGQLVHVLVALTFLGPRPDGMQTNHKDGCKTHNAATNLEYVTGSANVQHAIRSGLAPWSVSKISDEDAAIARFIQRVSGCPASAFAPVFGVSKSTARYQLKNARLREADPNWRRSFAKEGGHE